MVTFGGVYRRIAKRVKYFHPMLRWVDRRIPLDWVLNRSMLSDAKKYCYFRIPKCANSTIVRTLAFYDSQLELDESDEKGAAIKKATRGGLMRARTASIRTLTTDYYCFTFVRNPYIRTLSAYLDKIVAQGETEKYAHLRQKIREASGVDEVSFESFVTYLERGGLYKDPHWCPQVALLPLPANRLAFVGKVESLEGDLNEVVNIVFGRDVYKGAKTREVNRQESENKVSLHYSDSLRSRVYKLFEEDFASFGYQ